MELWIRSQDREVLLVCKQVYYFEINDKHIIATDLELVQRGYDYQDLGIYKTKEKALEVLNEIHQRLIDLQSLEFTSDLRVFKNRELDCVYQMPDFDNNKK